MKTVKMLLIFGLITISYTINAQINRYNQPAGATYKPLTREEIMLVAQANAIRAEAERKAAIEREQAFKYYQELAYQSLNKGNKREFITFSNTAISYGWYSSTLYYDRGIAYRDLGYKQYAKKELKKAKKYGYPISNKIIRLLLK